MIFLCLFLPPVAVMLMGRPWSAFLNLFLCLFCGIPGIIHALWLRKEQREEQHHTELLAATTGQPPPPPRQHHLAAVGMLLLVLLVLTSAALLVLYPAPPPVAPASPAPPLLPALQGLTLAQVQALHGPPSSTDKTTGWATWPTFSARFQAGTVQEVK